MTDLQAEHLGPVEIKHVGSATVTVLPRRLRRVRWDRRIHVGSAGPSHAGLSAHEAGIHQSPVWWCRVSRPGRTTRGRARDAPTENRTTIAYHRRTIAGSPHAGRVTARSERRGAPGPAPLAGAARQTETPFKPVRARRCRPSSRSLWGVRIGSFNRRSKRRLSGGRPGRADRMELGSGCNRQYGTLTPRSPPAVSSRIYKVTAAGHTERRHRDSRAVETRDERPRDGGSRSSVCAR